MLQILTVSLKSIETHFDEVRPDVLLAFVPCTFGEYLYYLVARARDIPCLFLYPTKIQNYMVWMNDFFGRPDVIVDAYKSYEEEGRRDQWTEQAERYLSAVREKDVRYEGMIPSRESVRTTKRIRLAPVSSGYCVTRPNTGSPRQDSTTIFQASLFPCFIE